MIRLFVLDLDGCVSHPFRTPHWESITRIRELNRLSRTDPTIPALSICSGRPMPYVEAYAQWLDIDQPIIFESGGGLYEPKYQRLHWNDLVNGELVERVQGVRKWAVKQFVDEIPGTLLEFAKKLDVGLIHTDPVMLSNIVEQSRSHVMGNGDLFEVHQTDVSVNIILKICNKASGIQWISQITGVPVEEMAFIGDSTGDISGLKLVTPNGYAPSNAREEVKQYARVMPAETSQAVLMAYQEIISKNRAL